MFDKDITQLIKPPQFQNNFNDSLKERIVNRLKECGFSDGKWKFEAKVVLFVAIMIESAIAPQQKLDKRGLLLSVWKEIWGLSVEDEIVIKNTLEMLIINKKVKRKSYYKLYLTSLAECFRL